MAGISYRILLLLVLCCSIVLSTSKTKITDQKSTQDLRKKDLKAIDILTTENFEDIDAEELRQLLLSDVDDQHHRREVDINKNYFEKTINDNMNRITNSNENRTESGELTNGNEHNMKGMSKETTKKVLDAIIQRMISERRRKAGTTSKMAHDVKLSDENKTIRQKNEALVRSGSKVKAIPAKFASSSITHRYSQNSASIQNKHEQEKDSIVFSTLEAIAHNILRVLKHREGLKDGSKLRYKIKRDDLLKIRDFIRTTRNPKLDRREKVSSAKEALNAIKHLMMLIKKKDTEKVMFNKGKKNRDSGEFYQPKEMQVFPTLENQVHRQTFMKSKQDMVKVAEISVRSAGNVIKKKSNDSTSSSKKWNSAGYLKKLKELRLKLLKVLKTKAYDNKKSILDLNSFKDELHFPQRKRRDIKEHQKKRKKTENQTESFKQKKMSTENTRLLKKIIKQKINKLKIMTKHKDVQTGLKRFLLIHGQNNFRKNLISLAHLDGNKISGKDLKKLHDQLNDWIRDEEKLERTPVNAKTKNEITSELYNLPLQQQVNSNRANYNNINDNDIKDENGEKMVDKNIDYHDSNYNTDTNTNSVVEDSQGENNIKDNNNNNNKENDSSNNNNNYSENNNDNKNDNKNDNNNDNNDNDNNNNNDNNNINNDDKNNNDNNSDNNNDNSNDNNNGNENNNYGNKNIDYNYNSDINNHDSEKYRNNNDNDDNNKNGVNDDNNKNSNNINSNNINTQINEDEDKSTTLTNNNNEIYNNNNGIYDYRKNNNNNEIYNNNEDKNTNHNDNNNNVGTNANNDKNTNNINNHNNINNNNYGDENKGATPTNTNDNNNKNSDYSNNNDENNVYNKNEKNENNNNNNNDNNNAGINNGNINKNINDITAENNKIVHSNEHNENGNKFKSNKELSSLPTERDNNHAQHKDVSNRNKENEKNKVNNADYEDDYDYSDEDDGDEEQTKAISVSKHQDNLQKQFQHNTIKGNDQNDMEQRYKHVQTAQNVNLNNRALNKDADNVNSLRGKGVYSSVGLPLYTDFQQMKPTQMINEITSDSKQYANIKSNDHVQDKIVDNKNSKNLDDLQWKNHELEKEILRYNNKNLNFNSQFSPEMTADKVVHRHIHHKGRVSTYKEQTPHLNEKASSKFISWSEAHNSQGFKNYKNQQLNNIMDGKTFAGNNDQEENQSNVLPTITENQQFNTDHKYISSKNGNFPSYRLNQDNKNSDLNTGTGLLQNYHFSHNIPQQNFHGPQRFNKLNKNYLVNEKLGKTGRADLQTTDAQEVSIAELNNPHATEMNKPDETGNKVNKNYQPKIQLLAGTDTAQISKVLTKGRTSNSNHPFKYVHGKALLSDFLSEENASTDKFTNEVSNRPQTVRPVKNNSTKESTQKVPVKLLESDDVIQDSLSNRTESRKSDKEIFNFYQLTKVNAQIQGSIRNRLTNVIHLIKPESHPKSEAKVVISPSISDSDSSIDNQTVISMLNLKKVSTMVKVANKKTKTIPLTRTTANEHQNTATSVEPSPETLDLSSGGATEDHIYNSNYMMAPPLTSDTQIMGSEKVAHIENAHSLSEPNNSPVGQNKVEIAQKTSSGDIMPVGQGPGTNDANAAQTTGGIPPEHVLVSPNDIKGENSVLKPLAQDPEGKISAIEDVQAISKVQKEQENTQQDAERISDPAFLEGMSNRIQMQGSPVDDLSVTHAPSVPLRDINFPGSTLMVSSDKLKRDAKGGIIGNKTSLSQENGDVLQLSGSMGSNFGAVASATDKHRFPVTPKLTLGQSKSVTDVRQLASQINIPKKKPEILEEFSKANHNTAVSSTNAELKVPVLNGAGSHVVQLPASPEMKTIQPSTAGGLTESKIASRIQELLKAVLKEKEQVNSAKQNTRISLGNNADSNTTNKLAEEIFDDPTKFSDGGILLNSEKQETKPYYMSAFNNKNRAGQVFSGVSGPGPVVPGSNFDVSKLMNSSADKSKASVFLPNIAPQPDGEDVFLGGDAQAMNPARTMSLLSKSNLSNEEKLKLINSYRTSADQKAETLSKSNPDLPPRMSEGESDQLQENVFFKTGKPNGHELKGDVAGKEAAMEDVLMLEKERDNDNKLSQAHLIASQPNKLKGNDYLENGQSNMALADSASPGSQLQPLGIDHSENELKQNAAFAEGSDQKVVREGKMEKFREDRQGMSFTGLGQENVAGEMSHFASPEKLKSTSQLLNSNELNTGIDSDKKAIENNMEPNEEKMTDDSGETGISRFVDSVQGLSPAEMKAYGININNDVYIDKTTREQLHRKSAQATYNAMMQESEETKDVLKGLKKSNVYKLKKKKASSKKARIGPEHIIASDVVS